MNKAMKYAAKELPRLGAELVFKGDRILDFRMPDGSKWTCNAKVSERHVQTVVEFWRQKTAGDYLSKFKTAHSAPSLKGVRLRQTRHFHERWQLMVGQGMRSVEVRDALFKPRSVRTTASGRLLYCGERVGVVVAVRDGVASAVTCLWTTDELWEKNPRNEVERG